MDPAMDPTSPDFGSPRRVGRVVAPPPAQIGMVAGGAGEMDMAGVGDLRQRAASVSVRSSRSGSSAHDGRQGRLKRASLGAPLQRFLDTL